MKRPDRFPRILVELVDSDSQQLRLIQVTMKPVRSGVGQERLVSLRQPHYGDDITVRNRRGVTLDPATAENVYAGFGVQGSSVKYLPAFSDFCILLFETANFVRVTTCLYQSIHSCYKYFEL